MTAVIEQRQVLEEIKQFIADEIMPLQQAIYHEGGVPRTLIDSMAKRGYLAASISEEYGGLGMSPLLYGQFTELFGKACPATRSLLTVHTSLVSETIAKFGTSEQKAAWLPKLVSGEWIGAFGLTEPEVGSDAKSVKTSWKEVEDGYILNGTKKWITYGNLADVFIIVASCDGRSSTFLVEREQAGVSTKPLTKLMAGTGTHLAEIQLDQVKIPKHYMIGKKGFGFEYVVSSALDQGRYSVAWAGLAIAQAALERMVTYSRKRVQFDQKLSQFQTIRAMIGDAVTNIHAARALCEKAAEKRLIKAGDATMETTIAKYFASKVAVQVTNDALQVHGANGFHEDYGVERLYREAKVLEIIEGSSQMQQEIISHYGLKQYVIRGDSM